jgi:hypothetical protein
MIQENINNTSENKKYAVCVYGQLRAIPTIIDNFNKYLIEPLNADLYVYVQTTGTEIDANINLFNTPNKILYTPPDVTKVFINYPHLEKRNNYINVPYLNVYDNWYKISEEFGDILEKKYEYVIVTRSDFLHLFPVPDIISLYNNNDLIWSYDGHEWGGINTNLLCIPAKYIKDYLRSCYNYLQDSNNITRLNNMCLNTEMFQKLIFNDYMWKIGKIEPNAFIAASSKNEICTWYSSREIQYCPEKKVFYKYIDQLNRASNALSKYEKSKQWVFKNNTIVVDY